MTHTLTVLSVLTALALPPSASAFAANSSAVATEGATIRLIAGQPDATGLVRGAILFELDAGWKTYWQEPGEVGLAPTFEFIADGAMIEPTLFFPAPTHLDEAGTLFNGYDGTMAIAFEVAVGEADILELDLLAGLCRDLCVPVSAHLRRNLGEPPGFADVTTVERAFLSRAVDRGETTGATLLADELHVVSPSHVPSTDDLFVSGPHGWRFGVARNANDGWRVPVLDRPHGSGETGASFEAVIGDDGVGRRLTIEIDETEQPIDGLPDGAENQP